MLSTVATFVRGIAVCWACALVLAFSTSAALAAPQDDVPEASVGTQVVDFAEQYVGTPYRFGGASPSGFDCTGFVMYVYSHFGVSLPHTEAGQLAGGPRVSADHLQPGDVLVFANTYRSGLSHTGIYVGGGQFVHAANERHGVMVSALDGYWGPRLVGAARAIS